jgi:hypothetical protein
LQSGSALLPAYQRPALQCQQKQQQQQRSRHAVTATAGDGDSRDYSQEEADAYAEILRQRSEWLATAGVNAKLAQRPSALEYCVQAWDLRDTCKHIGAVLPLPFAPVGRGVNGINAMA